MRFSQRLGINEVRSAIQKESIDTPLRNKLWDIVALYLHMGDGAFLSNTRYGPNYRVIWTDFFERASDEVPELTSSANKRLREWFYAAEWHGVYDLVEFCIQRATTHRLYPEQVQAQTNSVLERYLAAYRLVDGQFVPVTDEQAIKAIESAMDNPLTGVNRHLSNALALLGNRSKPDPANSIKESVSAVESLCSAIVGKKATLGEAIKRLKDNGISIHPALEKGWGNLYGWTSDAHGIRHAMQDDPGLSVDDAVYFLVSCSAFIGLLTEKATAANVALQPVN